jgi:hypothetical protein
LHSSILEEKDMYSSMRSKRKRNYCIRAYLKKKYMHSSMTSKRRI